MFEFYKKHSLMITAFLMLLTAVITFQCTSIFYMAPGGEDTSAQSALPPSIQTKLNELIDLYDQYYVDEIDEKQLESILLNGYIAGAGDEFGYYLAEEEFSDYMQDSAGEFYGIGVSVIWNAEYGAIEIITVYPESPALEAGVLPGDLITHAFGESVSSLGYTESVNRLRGEEGTFAEFTVQRGENYGEKVEFKVRRAPISEISVTWRMYSFAKNVAVIKIVEFDQKTAEQFVSCVNEAFNAGADGIVFDVRYNPGGDLRAICAILDALLPEGPIIRIDYKGKDNDYQIDSDANCTEFPMIVLCNGSTASAGELFCSALQDYGIAKLVGTQTYGKGTMQSILEMSSGGGIGVTVAYYLPPFSDNYHGVGVTPDVVVEMPPEFASINPYKITDEQDVQLQAAVATLLEEMSKSEDGGIKA